MNPGGTTIAPPGDSGGESIRRALHTVLWLLRGIMALLVLFYLFSGVTIVGAGQVALVERFGRLLEQVHPPGLVWAWPRPIDRVILLPGRQVLELSWEEWAPQAVEEGEPIARAALHPARHGYSLTGDQNILQGRFVLRYRVNDPAAYFRGAADPSAALRQVLGQSLTRALAATTVDEVLSDGRPAAAAEALRLTQETLARLDLGLEVLALEFAELVPPVWVFSAFEEVIQAQVEAETEVENALNERARLLPEAEATAHRILAEASAEARMRVLQATAAADTFLRVLPAARTEPEAFRARRFSEMWDRLAPRWQNTLVLPSTQPPPALWLPGRARPGFEPTLPTQPASPMVPALQLPVDSLEEWDQLPE
jgi:regulator of protease activity HflC (stomatin/prohibitin superfamily)